MLDFVVVGAVLAVNGLEFRKLLAWESKALATQNRVSEGAHLRISCVKDLANIFTMNHREGEMALVLADGLLFLPICRADLRLSEVNLNHSVHGSLKDQLASLGELIVEHEEACLSVHEQARVLGQTCSGFERRVFALN